MIAAMFYVDINADYGIDSSDSAVVEDLTAAGLDRIREHLGSELAQVKRGLADVWARKALAAHVGRHNASVDHIKENQRATELYDSLQQRRAEILDTIKRIEGGVLDRCIVCGGSISSSLLEESPTNRLCVGCLQ